MTDHNLPDDVSLWPDDPYVLLGIDAGVDERGLKKAYAKLIRRFKPEHHPQQFSRIRAAYEHILERLTWLTRRQSTASETIIEKTGRREQEYLSHSNSNSPDDASSDPLSSDPPIKEESSNRPVHPFHEVHRPNPDDPRRHPEIEKDIAKAMQSVTEGDPAGGYGQLAALSEQNLPRSDIDIKLYWLLRVFPQLDTEKHPAQWLLIALAKTQLDGPAWDLYCSELKCYPKLVLEERHQQLLDVAETTGQLFNFLEVTLRAASFQNFWTLMNRQLIRVRDIVKDKNSDAWARILFRVMDFAAWSSDKFPKKMIQFIDQELRELSGFPFRFDLEFRRYDYLVHMRTESLLDQFRNFFDLPDFLSKSRRADLVSPEFLHLTRGFWTDPEEISEAEIFVVLQSWAANPGKALAMLESFRENANTGFHHIRRLIRSIDRRQSVRETPGRLSLLYDTVQKFLEQHECDAYGVLQGKLLEFCISTGIEISEIVENFEDTLTRQMVGGTFDKLRIDAPLEIAALGIITFWTS